MTEPNPEAVLRHVTPGCGCHTCRTLLMIFHELWPDPADVAWQEMVDELLLPDSGDKG